MTTDIFSPRFQNEDKAREHLEAVRWGDTPFCPHCGSLNVTRLEGKKHRVGLLQCNEGECRKQFTVTVGTVFERSKIALHKWLLATHLLCASKKGMSAHQLHRMIGVTYKTAWFMAHRIREAMNQPAGPLGGEPSKPVIADETWVGGSQQNQSRRLAAPKKIVVTLIEKGGQARSFHVANIHANTLRPLLFEHADRLSTLVTDENPSYAKIGEQFWAHKTVNHSLKQYARGEWSTNAAENFFSIFKRGVVGTYHHMSAAHLHRYCAEFDFRYNTRTDTDAERADQALAGIYGKRLMYRRTNSLAA